MLEFNIANISFDIRKTKTRGELIISLIEGFYNLERNILSDKVDKTKLEEDLSLFCFDYISYLIFIHREREEFIKLFNDRKKIADLSTEEEPYFIDTYKYLFLPLQEARIDFAGSILGDKDITVEAIFKLIKYLSYIKEENSKVDIEEDYSLISI